MFEWVNNFIRIPFQSKGRSHEGADCWGLVRIVYDEMCGIDLPSLDTYDHTKDRQNMGKTIHVESTKWISINKGSEKPFDVIVFKMVGIPAHVGVVVGNGYMIHCQEAVGTCVEDYNSEKWRRRIEGIYRHSVRANATAPVQPS